MWRQRGQKYLRFYLKIFDYISRASPGQPDILHGHLLANFHKNKTKLLRCVTSPWPSRRCQCSGQWHLEHHGLLGHLGLLHHLYSVCLYCNFHQDVKLSPGIKYLSTGWMFTQSKQITGNISSWWCLGVVVLQKFTAVGKLNKVDWVTKYSYEYSVLPGQVSHQQFTQISHR